MFTCKGRVYPNRFKNHAKSAVKHIISQACLGWIVPSLMVFPCLSQDFVSGGNYLRFRQSGMPFLPRWHY